MKAAKKAAEEAVPTEKEVSGSLSDVEVVGSAQERAATCCFFRHCGEARSTQGGRIPMGSWGWQIWHAPASACEAVVPLVKKEVEEILSDTASEAKKKKRPVKKRTMGETLMKAAKVRIAVEDRKEKKKKSRSRSRSRRRRKKRRRSSESDNNSSSSRGSSSSGASMMAPLKKKSQKAPGSVFQLLEQQAIEQLSADGVIEEGYEAAGLRGQRPKMGTYYQLILKPHLDMKSRDAKELAMLARSLDLLRDGRLPELADVLSARLLAVDTSTRQGWGMARHLEVFCKEDTGSVPAHVLLSAQRHARQVEKAGGRGSWQRWPASYGGDWSSDGKGKSRGKEAKGKGKKGKGKGKGGRGGWNTWGPDPEDKGMEKGKKAEGET